MVTGEDLDQISPSIRVELTTNHVVAVLKGLGPHPQQVPIFYST